MVGQLFDAATAFLVELEHDNSAEFFRRERGRYDAARDVFAEVCNRVPGWGPWRIYRPHNDRRFRPDTPPYKTFLGAVSERPDGVGAFVRVDAGGVLVGTGLPVPAGDQLNRLRVAVAAEDSGSRLEDAIAAARRSGGTVHGGRWPALKRLPRGCPPDSPRADLLRWKGIEFNVRVPSPPWSSIEDATAAVSELLAAPIELNRWLGEHVGPSRLSAEERFAPRRNRRA